MENLHNKALCITKDLAGVFFSISILSANLFNQFGNFFGNLLFSDKVAIGDLTLGWINSDYPLFDQNV